MPRRPLRLDGGAQRPRSPLRRRRATTRSSSYTRRSPRSSAQPARLHSRSVVRYVASHRRRWPRSSAPGQAAGRSSEGNSGPPAGAAGRRPTARSRAPALRGRPARGSRGPEQRAGAVGPCRQVPQPPGQRLRLHRAGPHQLDVLVQGVGQQDGDVVRPHPHPLAQLGQPGVGERPTAGTADLRGAARSSSPPPTTTARRRAPWRPIGWPTGATGAPRGARPVGTARRRRRSPRRRPPSGSAPPGPGSR